MVRSLLFVLLCAAFFPLTSSAQMTALDIIREMDALSRGNTQAGKYTMTIVRPDWDRTMVFNFWSEGTEKSFIRIQDPVKERGVSFLKINREMWQFIPRINRSIKIPPSMMLQSWMGSDFTNDDLVRESSIVDDYEHTLIREEVVEGIDTYVIESKPKPDAPVAWDLTRQWIQKDLLVPIRSEYFNQRGERIRTMNFSDIQEVDGRPVARRMELVEENKPGHKTILELTEVRFDIPIQANIFTQQNLRRTR